MFDKKEKSIIKIAAIIALFILFITKFDFVIATLNKVLRVLYPFILGVFFAFIINLLVKRFEAVILPKAKKKGLVKLREFLSILISVVIILLVVVLALNMVVPQLVETVKTLIDNIPEYTEGITKFLDKNHLFPKLSQDLAEFDNKKLMETFMSNSGEISTGAIKFAQSFLSILLNLFIAFVFAIYIVANKYILHGQYDKLTKAYFPKGKVNRFNKFLETANYIFDKYFVGQFIEAIILGTLCALGMHLLGLPYATMIGSLVGITALIPIIGAYIGEIVGFLLIMTVDPLKAVIFLIFLLTLQQIEGTFIYPKVVGKSVGVPGMWILFAVTVGAGLFGLFGVILSVPITALIYTLLKEDVNERIALQKKDTKKATK